MKEIPHYYETTMRLFLGDKADHCAGEAHYLPGKKKRLRALAKELIRAATNIDTTERHKERITQDLVDFDEELKSHSPDPWALFYVSLRIIGRLMGYDFLHGAKPHTPVYYQTPEQLMTTEILSGGDNMILHHKRKSALAIRRDLVNKLADEGMTYFDISMVFGISEYKVKQLRVGT